MHNVITNEDTKTQVIGQAHELCRQNNGTLLYLCIFGSHLYGTNTPESDMDFKGLFLPSKESCILGKPAKSLNYSSGDDAGKNTKDDIDLQLWSLQYFLELVSKGETNALDLLYSHTYPEMILYKACIMDKIFENHNKLYSIKNCNAYVGYAIGQAKKYGIKGSRLGVLKNIKEWLQGFFKEAVRTSDPAKASEHIRLIENKKLVNIISLILYNFEDKSYCFQKDINGVNSIVILGKVHLGTITIGEFRARIFRDYAVYGERAEAAMRSEGVDFKALSHACRALMQMRMLIHNGKIEYPLYDGPFLKKIKKGLLFFNEVEEIISKDIELIKYTLETKDFSDRESLDRGFIKEIILGAYGFGGGRKEAV